MNSLERNKTIIEQEGFDYSTYAFDLAVKLNKSHLYSVSLINLEKASNISKRKSVINTYHELRDLDFNVHSLVEYANLETKVMSLAIKSSPNWWINPFDQLSNEEENNKYTIGDLFVNDDGNLTVNDLIKSESISTFEKKNLIATRIEFYRKDMSDKFLKALDENTNKINSSVNTFKNIIRMLQFLFFIFANTFLIFLFAVPSNKFIDAFYHPSVASIETWIIFLTAFTVPIADFFYSLDVITKIKTNESESYAKNYSKFKKKKYLSKLNEYALELQKEIYEKIDLKKEITTSINKYSNLMLEIFDLNKLKLEDKTNERKRTAFVVIHNLNLAWSSLIFFVIIFAIISLIIIS